MNTKHTPTPWIFVQKGANYSHNRIDSSTYLITNLQPASAMARDEQIANGELIVRAVNSHEELLAAAIMARNYVAEWRNSVNADDWQRVQTLRRLEDILVTAIAQAEEKS